MRPIVFRGYLAIGILREGLLAEFHGPFVDFILSGEAVRKLGGAADNQDQ